MVALFTVQAVLGAFLWLFLAGLYLAGVVLFVVALIRWRMNSWKFVLLVLILVPLVAPAIGWVALVAGGVRRSAETGTQPPPPYR